VAQDIPRQTMQRLLRDVESAKERGLSKGGVMDDYAADLGVSTSTLHRRLQALRGKQKSGGGRKRSVPRELVRAVLRLKERGKQVGRVDQEREISTEEAQRILQRKGWEDATEYSASQINRIAREEMGYRREGRVTRFEAAYATEVYLLDFSRLKAFQVFDENDQGEYLLKTTRRSMSYKEPQGNFRAWIALLVDDHSRMTLGHIFATTGEDPRLGLNFLTWAFSREKDEHALRYAPETLQTDAGAFDAEASRRALADCSIDLAGGFSKHAQGKVERAFRSLWQRWELPLALEKPEGWTITLPELNALLHEHLTREARQPHPTHRRCTREQMYSASLPGHARTLDGVDLTALAYDVETRTVHREGIVSVDGQKLQVPQHTPGGTPIAVGDEVRVMRSLASERYKGRLADKVHADAFALTPYAPARRGDYDTLQEDTISDKLADQVDLSRPVGHILQDDRQGTRDLYDELSAGTLEMPDVLPRPSVIRPSGPFAPGPEAAPDDDGRTATGELDVQPEPEVLPENEAKKYVARRLEALGSNYKEAEPLFAELIETGATRPQLDDRLALLEKEIAAEQVPAASQQP
jgi:hypothetical protein